MNPDLFDYAESVHLKNEGMQTAADNAPIPLHIAREIAVAIALMGNGTCNMDQVGEVLAERGIPTGNWAGSVFKDPCWEFTGMRIRSTRVANHAREIKVWRLVSR